MTFGEILRKTREQANLSQEGAAKSIEAKYKVRLSASYLSMIENDLKTNLTVKLINALLDFFNLPLNVAASLFTRPVVFPDCNPGTRLAFRESGCDYPPRPLSKQQPPELPQEAQRMLDEFHDFLLSKYHVK